MTGKGIWILTTSQTNKNDTQKPQHLNTSALYNVYENVFYRPELL